jgi:hypothetical protein
MKGADLFEILTPLVAPALEAQWGRRDLCVLATRVVIDVAAFFGIEAKPLPVQVILYNAPFARRVASGFAGVDRGNPSSWGDGSWSVGIGCGKPAEPGKWDGHLIAVGDGAFGDFSISQAERQEHGIYTGPAIVGPYTGAASWQAIYEETGTVVEYKRIADDYWRGGPDWRNPSHRRPAVGALIRAVREMQKASAW